MKSTLQKYKYKILLVGIILFSMSLRLYNVKWDQGTHQHPDERFLTMLTSDMSIPKTFADYLNPEVSTLNPYNTKYNFYVYGTFPVTLNKLVSHAVDMDSYDGSLVTGRILSAIADTGTVLFVILIAGLFAKKYKLSWYFQPLAGFFYGISVLAIQHGHFFTVDSFTTLFTTGALYFACSFMYGSKEYRLFHVLALSICMGLAGASKSSSIFIAPLIGFIMVYAIWFEWNEKSTTFFKIKQLLFYSFIALFSAYAVLRIGDPRLFATVSWFDVHINPKFLANIKELQNLTRNDSFFPPNIQWMSKQPILFPLRNIAIFGLGIPLFALMLWGAYSIVLSKKKEIMALIVWALIFFLYQGSRFVTTTRYFYMLYPIFALAAAWGWVNLSERIKIKNISWKWLVVVVSLLVISLWPASFMSIYTRPHSRVSASVWIFNNIPSGSFIASEYWDDALPLMLPQYADKIYQGEQMPVFGDDTTDKWKEMDRILKKADYYIMSSNRAYDSIMPLQSRFPRMAAYYKQLFSGEGDFELAAEITSYPTIPFTDIRINDQWSDEAFTVYDHPRILIYKKKPIRQSSAR
jgi:hypothetical protein